MLVDTHIHLDFLADPPRALDAARAAGVGAWVVPGVEPGNWSRLMNVATPGVWAAPGVHPQAADQWRPELAGELLALAADGKTAAIGEVGLDGLAAPEQTVQERVFRAMIAIARESRRPLLLHLRRATGRALAILREERAFEVGGIAHAYSGSLETARQLVDLGFAIGLGGVVTYPETLRLQAVAVALPSEWLVLETDAPDLPPHPHRGVENRAEWLVLIAARVAELRGWSPEETARVTTANARRVLRLPAHPVPEENP